MEVKIKKLHPDAIIPKYSKPGDAGLDLTVVSMEFTEDGCITYDTGIAVEIPEGYVGLVFPRSSISKMSIQLTNSVGVIDSGYRGSIKAKFKPALVFSDKHDGKHQIYDLKERALQLIIIPYPMIEFKEVDELSSTDRAQGGFGSTGN